MSYNEHLALAYCSRYTYQKKIHEMRFNVLSPIFRKSLSHYIVGRPTLSRPGMLLYRGTWCLCQSCGSHHARRYCLHIARRSTPSFDSEKRHGEVEDRIVVRGSSRVCGANWEEVRIGRARLESAPSKQLFSHFVDGARTRRGEYGLGGISEMAPKQVMSSLSSTCLGSFLSLQKSEFYFVVWMKKKMIICLQIKHNLELIARHITCYIKTKNLN